MHVHYIPTSDILLKGAQVCSGDPFQISHQHPCVTLVQRVLSLSKEVLENLNNKQAVFFIS